MCVCVCVSPRVRVGVHVVRACVCVCARACGYSRTDARVCTVKTSYAAGVHKIFAENYLSLYPTSHLSS